MDKVELHWLTEECSAVKHQKHTKVICQKPQWRFQSLFFFFFNGTGDCLQFQTDTAEIN